MLQLPFQSTWLLKITVSKRNHGFDLRYLAAVLCPKAEGDALLWFAYPKGTSKKYKCDFNRDGGWRSVRAPGFNSVRQIAIDEDWPALRFRRSEYVKASDRKSG